MSFMGLSGLTRWQMTLVLGSVQPDKVAKQGTFWKTGRLGGASVTANKADPGCNNQLL
jgi:hypothetical protein